MSFYLGEHLINNGDPLKVGDAQISKIMLGTEQVWVNNQAPSAITDFDASSSGANASVTVTFSSASGIPTPTYDLYENDVSVATGISSGYVYTSAVTGNNTYYVKAVNSAGSVNSNSDTAVVWTGGSSLTITASGDYTAGVDFPANVTISVCMCGGGGGGGDVGDLNAAGLGGKAGIVVSNTITSIPYGEIVSANIGAGGSQYQSGGSSSFGSYFTAGGGAPITYRGRDDSKTTCGGTGYDGRDWEDWYHGVTWYGGESSGFGDGGDATGNNGQNGGVGSGGGSCDYGTAGSGGRGEIRLSW